MESRSDEAHQKDPFIAVLVAAKGDRGKLLRPGCPVFNVRDELFGYVVVATNGEPLVHAPTEGDGDLHDLDLSWGLCLWDDGRRVDAGWDRLRRSAFEILPSAELDPVSVRMLRPWDLSRFEPTFDDVNKVCGIFGRAKLASDLVLWDEVRGDLVRRT